MAVRVEWAIKTGLVALAVAVGAWVGLQGAPRVTAGLPVVKTQQQVEQEMFQAVKQLLANVPRQDQPKRIITAKKEADGRYLVHVEMVQGDGWFRLTWNGSTWTAVGVNPPPQ